MQKKRKKRAIPARGAALSFACFFKMEKRKAPVPRTRAFLEVTPGFEPGNQGFADPCLTTWLCHHLEEKTLTSQQNKRPFSCWSGRRGSNSLPPPWQGGALPDELHPQLWCLRTESNHRHGDFQSPALPTELQRHNTHRHNCSGELATRMGLEPTTSSVTG